MWHALVPERTVLPVTGAEGDAVLACEAGVGASDEHVRDAFGPKRIDGATDRTGPAAERSGRVEAPAANVSAFA